MFVDSVYSIIFENNGVEQKPHTMSGKDFELLVSIFLVYRVKSCRNGYDLTKILAWKFGILDSPGCIRKMAENELVIITRENGLAFFKVTEKGEQYAKELFNDSFYAELLNKNPTQKEYIDLLFYKRKDQVR
jgi:hypothetical protein